MGYIYLITNTITGKQYIGQTTQLDVNKRWTQHKTGNYSKKGGCLSKAIEKYGVDNFKFQIVCICFDEDCNKYEIEYIKKFNTISPNGYNLESGGKNHKCHPDTIKKLSDLFSGEKNPMFGKKWTEELRKKRSTDTVGKKNPNYGKKSVNRKNVGMFDENNILIQRFDSIHQASIETDIHERCISGVCRGEHKKAGGFIWKFL
jgi:group I intron endonuclease